MIHRKGDTAILTPYHTVRPLADMYQRGTFVSTRSHTAYTAVQETFIRDVSYFPRALRFFFLARTD